MKLLTFADLKPMKGIPYSRDHLRLMVKQGRFPAPVVLTESTRANCQRIAWTEAAIDQWVADRMAATSDRAA